MKIVPLPILLPLAALLAVRIVVMAVTPVFEPSEARYAAISANMSRTGDFLVPRFTYKGEYRPFSGKPPLVFQSSALICRAIGVTPFAVRVVPFASFLLLLAAVFASMRKIDGCDVAMSAVLVCSTSIALYATAGFCMTDVPLACCIAGALFVYARFRETPSVFAALVVGVFLGCGMLVKGPVTLALFGVSVFADAVLNKRWRTLFDLRWLAALPVFVAVAAPWFVMMHRADPGFLEYFFINENLLRFLVHDYGDRYGAGRETFRGMALIWTFVVMVPWSLLPLRRLIPFGDGIRGLKAMPKVPHDFFLVSALAITGFWCLTSRVPLAYLLPVVPLLSAYLARRECDAVRRLFPYAVGLSCFAVCVTLLCTALFTNKMPGDKAEPRIRGSRYSYEFYNGPWGKGAPQ